MRFQEQGSKQAWFKLPTIENPFKKDKKDSSSSSSSSSDEDEKVKIETPKPPVVEIHKPIVSSPVQRQDSSSSSSSSDEDSKNKAPSKPGFKLPTIENPFKKDKKDSSSSSSSTVMRSSDEDEKVKIETPKPPVVEFHKPIVSSPVQRHDSTSSSSSSDEDSKNKAPSKPGFKLPTIENPFKKDKKDSSSSSSSSIDEDEKVKIVEMIGPLEDRGDSSILASPGIIERSSSLSESSVDETYNKADKSLYNEWIKHPFVRPKLTRSQSSSSLSDVDVALNTVSVKYLISKFESPSSQSLLEDVKSSHSTDPLNVTPTYSDKPPIVQDRRRRSRSFGGKPINPAMSVAGSSLGSENERPWIRRGRQTPTRIFTVRKTRSLGHGINNGEESASSLSSSDLEDGIPPRTGPKAMARSRSYSNVQSRHTQTSDKVFRFLSHDNHHNMF
ncbi:uncharacterized protein DDB_G0271670-like isoform X2 [Tigriopus californicus]|uniref:uncharacterized protein DDB_G0271670-like isoform X2 n=1 Tax=Tigriopus californicus TaxID=6832 RepID=UPI0027DA662C|nr:uncharacterized protein DDB_G0271670-like isoform X2 [Tigriopus californicus]